LQNLPVGTPPLKSLPYGGKLHLADVAVILLLLPVSMIESPNTNTAGTETFGGSSTDSYVLQITVKKRTDKRRSELKVEART